MSTWLWLFLLIGVLWAAQIWLSWLQAQQFMREVGRLRGLGTTAIGTARVGRFGRRTYVALAAAADGTVAAGRRLEGVTVWARPRAAPEFEGRALAEIAVVGEQASPADQAAAMAAQTLRREALRGSRKEGEGSTEH